MEPALDGRDNGTDDAQRLAAIPVAAALVAVGSLVEIPMVPVPMSLQSLFVVAAGGLLGPAFGLTAMLVYLAVGAAGFPVFAGGSSGLEVLTGPTGGYLLGFPLCAYLSGWLARVTTKLAGKQTLAAALLLTVSFFVAHLMLLAIGSTWLRRVLELSTAAAFESGFTPFLLGALAKSALAAGLVMALSRISGEAPVRH